MRADDLRGKSTDELMEDLLGLRREQFNLRMQRGTGELAKHTEYGRVKKDIARIKTVLSELRIAAKAQKTDSGKSE
jgi:large subunit ribosomal protein L29